MRRPLPLLAQILLANVLLVGVAIVVTVMAVNPDVASDGGSNLFVVLVLAIALAMAVNLWLLQRRFLPLEQLIGEMERVSLEGPRETEGRGFEGTEDSVEVGRLRVAFHNMLDRLEEERRRAGRIALEAQEQERARVARDLHDEANQALTGILLHVEAARSKAPPELLGELAETKAYADQAMAELLGLARQLRPTALDDLGLRAALAALVEETASTSGLDARFEPHGELGALPEQAQLAIYRIVQEALSNVIQHADAGSVRVSTQDSGQGVELCVVDDGAGFDPTEPSTSLGIAGMRERALLAGGKLTVSSEPGAGTTVQLKLEHTTNGQPPGPSAATPPSATSPGATPDQPGGVEG
jgi:two-component system, NarL family, sensor histidine kinase UhpB